MVLPRLRRFALVAAAALLLASCAGSGGSSERSRTLRLGCFPNVTHAPALVGVGGGIFADALGDDVTLEISYFNAGPQAVEALFGEALDATFIGPNPAINAYAQSGGAAIRIIAGSTSGGAFFIVRPGISSAPDLVGTRLATPQLGNTQDVALRAWLLAHGLSFDVAGGGDVSILPQSNADTLRAFQAGDIDGAWVPEPWASRLIQEGDGIVFLDERGLWPEGLFVTTHLIVRTEFLEENPDLVKALLIGLIEAVRFTNANPAEAETLVNDQIEAITGARLPDPVIAAAWENLTFTWDPIASSLRKSADDAVAVGLLEPVDLDGIYALDILNRLLAEMGEATVEGQ